MVLGIAFGEAKLFVHVLSRFALGAANADEISVFREVKLEYLSTYSRRYHIRQTSLFVYFVHVF